MPAADSNAATQRGKVASSAGNQAIRSSFSNWIALGDERRGEPDFSLVGFYWIQVGKIRYVLARPG
jgi:hypothetical protein